MEYPTVEAILAGLPSGFRIDGEGTSDRYRVIVTKDAQEVGKALFMGMGDSFLLPQDVVVLEAFRRQGIASEMYRYAEEKTGRTIIPADEQTPEAQHLWDQSKRPFGKVHAAKKDLDLSSSSTAYEWALENVDGVSDADGPYVELNENRAEQYSDKYNDVMSESSIKLYRAVCLKKIEDLNLDKVGTHWSFTPEGVGCYGTMKEIPGSKEFILTGKVNPKDIDWEYGFTSFMWYGEDQWECALNPGAPVEILKIDAKVLENPLKGKAALAKASQRTLAKATIPEDSELMEFYYLADREGWAEQVSEEASEEWDRMSLEERKEVIPELISEGFSQHFPHKPKTEEDWKEVKGYFLSLRERQEADNTDSTQIFFEDAKIITNPTLVRFTDHPEGVMEHGFNGYGPRNLGLTMHYRPGIGDLAFAFDIKDLKTQKDWEHAEGSYGQYIFKFKVPYAVKAYHISDGEKQVVFDVTTVKDLKKIEMPLAKGRKKPGMKKDEEIPF